MRYDNVLADRDYHLNYDGCVYSALTAEGRVPVTLVCNEDRIRAHPASEVVVEVVDVDMNWPKLGLINTQRHKAAVLVTRRAARQYRRGPNANNLECWVIQHDSTPRRHGGGGAFEFNGQELYDPTYPSFNFALWMMSRGWHSVALSPDVAINATGLVFYRKWCVGELSEDMQFIPNEAVPAGPITAVKSILE